MSYAIHQSHFDLCKTTACLQCGLISSECFKVDFCADQYMCDKREDLRDLLLICRFNNTFYYFSLGMNLNKRMIGQHIEFEPQTYYASFSGELEAAASILWAMVSHLKDNSNNAKEFSANVIRHCLRAILEWMEAISYRSPELVRNVS